MDNLTLSHSEPVFNKYVNSYFDHCNVSKDSCYYSKLYLCRGVILRGERDILPLKVLCESPF